MLPGPYRQEVLNEVAPPVISASGHFYTLKKIESPFRNPHSGVSFKRASWMCFLEVREWTDERSGYEGERGAQYKGAMTRPVVLARELSEAVAV